MGYQRVSLAAPLTASGIAFTGAGRLGSICITPGSDATTITIYDKTTATGTILFHGKFVANAKTELIPYIPGLQFENGLYVAITGTSVSVICSTY